MPQTTTFAENRKAHLAEYKRNVLGIEESGIYDGRLYEHILPADKLRYNLLEGIREEFCRFSRWSDDSLKPKEFKLHDGFGHLNSLQALCFNLFFPLIASGRMVDLFRFLPGESVAKGVSAFEKILEDGTNVDFYFENDNGRHLFEIKYTETNFGPAAINERNPARTTQAYVDKFHAKYEKSLDIVLKRQLDMDHSQDNREEFFRNYQFFRYLSHLDDTTGIYFLIPEGNHLYDKARHMVVQWLRPEFCNQVHVIGLESLLQSLLNEEPFIVSASIYSDFWEKYLFRD